MAAKFRPGRAWLPMDSLPALRGPYPCAGLLSYGAAGGRPRLRGSPKSGITQEKSGKILQNFLGFFAYFPDFFSNFLEFSRIRDKSGKKTENKRKIVTILQMFSRLSLANSRFRGPPESRSPGGAI